MHCGANIASDYSDGNENEEAKVARFRLLPNQLGMAASIMIFALAFEFSRTLL